MDRDYYTDISDIVKDPFQAKVQRVLHSIAIYCLAYIFVNYINLYVAGFAASFFGFDPRVLYYGIYDLPISPSQWTKWSVLFVFASGPFVALIVGLIAFRINEVLREYNTTLKVFALWIAVHGITMFGSYCITSSFGTDDYQLPFYYGFAVVATWLHVDKVLMVPVTLIGMLLLILFGLIVIVAFLSLAYNRKVAINYTGRRQFIFEVAILPWLIGSVLCIFFSLPPNMAMRDLIMNLFKNASIFFIILGMWFRLDYIVGSIEVHSFDVFQKRFWITLLALLVTIALISKKHILNIIG